MKTTIFKTHKGEAVSGERLQQALNTVADFWAENAHACYRENAYAAHVTEATKIQALERKLAYSERVRSGEIPDFTTWQRVNAELTGECVGFLPKAV